MVSPQALVQLKAFARIDGAILAVVWFASMWFMFKMPDTVWGPALMLSTPFFLLWRLLSFRNNALDGVISFRRALAFTCYIFFYASILFALGQYVYFAYLDKGSFMQLLNESMNVMKPYYKAQGINMNDLDIALRTVKMMKPVDLTFTFMMNNLLIGALVSPLISLMGKRQVRG